MKQITLTLTDRTPKISFYCLLVNETESHLFEIHHDDNGISMSRMLDFIKEMCERFDEDLTAFVDKDLQ